MGTDVLLYMLSYLDSSGPHRSLPLFPSLPITYSDLGVVILMERSCEGQNVPSFNEAKQ